MKQSPFTFQQVLAIRHNYFSNLENWSALNYMGTVPYSFRLIGLRPHIITWQHRTTVFGFRFAVSYPGKKLGNFSIALSVSPWAI